MAVQSILSKTALTIKYKNGMDSSGNDILKSKKLSNIKVTADNQSINDTAAAFAPLLKYQVTDILRSDDNVLINA